MNYVSFEYWDNIVSEPPPHLLADAQDQHHMIKGYEDHQYLQINHNTFFPPHSLTFHV